MRAEHQALLTNPPEVRRGVSIVAVDAGVIGSEGVDQDDHDNGSSILVSHALPSIATTQAHGDCDRGRKASQQHTRPHEPNGPGPPGPGLWHQWSRGLFDARWSTLSVRFVLCAQF